MTINWKINTALFLSGQALSQFGSNVVQMAIMWHITLKSQSGSMMTLFTIVGILPMFFISPFAGVWADRYNRKHLINIADGTIAFFSMIVAVFLFFGYESYSILLLCAFFRSLGMGVQNPAVGSFIPMIVPTEHLTRINGFQSSIHSFVAVGSPMVAAALMTFAPLYNIFLLDVITATIGIVIVYFLVKIPATMASNSTSSDISVKPSYARELREGFAYIKQQGYLLKMITITAIFIFMVAPAAYLTPLQVARNFGDDVWRLSTIEITFFSGMLLGGLFIGYWGGFKNRIYTMTLSIIINGLLIMGLGITSSFWFYAFLMAIIGIAIPLFNTPAIVILQTKTEPEYMGRVVSVTSMNNAIMMPLGMLFFGPLADIISLDLIMIITGAIITLLFIPILASKVLIKAGEPIGE